MAMDKTDANFISTLDEISKKRAKEELNELNDADRAVAVETFRKWILDQEWLKTPTDFGFLLRFLRVRKFSQLGARETIANYWESRSESPEWFKDVDPANEKIQELLRTGFYICPRATDKHGRRVVYLRLGQLNELYQKHRKDADFVSHTVFKIIFMVNDWVLQNETVQVNGISFVMDYTDVSFQLFTAGFNIDVGRRFFRFLVKSQPARFKALHVYNEPSFYDVIRPMVWPFLSKKTRERRFAHGKSLVKIYEHLGMSVLPSEYCPDEYDGPSAGSAREIAEGMIEDMMKPEVRDYLLDLSSAKYGLIKEKKKVADKPAESFRQLKID